MVVVSNSEDRSILYGEDVIGIEVEVKALFKSGDVDVAAVEFERCCYCFRVSMLKPIHTGRDRSIEAMCAAVDAITDWERHDCSDIYNAIAAGKISGVACKPEPFRGELSEGQEYFVTDGNLGRALHNIHPEIGKKHVNEGSVFLKRSDALLFAAFEALEMGK